MNLLEQKSRAIYNQNQFSATFSNQEFELFISFLNRSVNETKFLNPYIFSDEYDVSIETSLTIFLFFTNTDEPLLNILPIIECLNSHCKDTLFLNPDEKYILCPECDDTFDITLFTRYLKFLFEINPSLLTRYIMSKQTNSYAKVKSIEAGLKHSPLSSIYKIKGSELEGGVSYHKLNDINDSPNGPISDPYHDIQKRISKSMAKAR